MAYGLVKRLKQNEKNEFIKRLAAGVQASEKEKGKKHQVFRLSFDAKECDSTVMVEQKLDYIHHNPVNGKWSLVEDYADYQHSSAGYYELNDINKYVTDYEEVDVSESLVGDSE